MKNLLSMTDFIYLQKMSFRTDKRFKQLIIEYANFLQQPLELWMFVPCDEDSNILVHPYDKIYPASMSFANEIENYNLKFRQAKERCLIEGFTYDGVEYIDYKNYCIRISVLPNLTFQDLTKYNLTLTPTALIQFT